MEEIYRKLAALALEARKNSYAPYSRFQVGAALLAESGKIYSGCNIENASYSATNCAERTAFFKAASEGERSFRAIAIAGGKTGAQALDFCAPCGVCRQVMKEFCGEDFTVLFVRTQDDWELHTLGELLPFGFGAAAFQNHGKLV